MNSFHFLPIHLSRWVHIIVTNYMTSFFVWFHITYEIIIDFIHSSMTESTIILHSSVQGEHYVCPVCDRLSVHGAVVWCIYRSYCKQLTCSLGRQVSIHRQGSQVWKQVKKWYVSRKPKKIWFIFAWINVEILPGNFLVIKQAIRLVGFVRKLMEYGHRLFDMLNGLLMVVLFLYIKIMWIATVERRTKKQCGFIFLSSSNFSIPSTTRFKRSILSMITIQCLFITSTMMSIRNIRTSM